MSLTLMALHEIDAIRCHEWRMIPGLQTLPEAVAKKVFVVGHLPLLVLLSLFFWSEQYAITALTYFNLFVVVHCFAHIFGRQSKVNVFTGFYSWFLILGSAVCSIIEQMLLRF
jgi:hypothetical protein